MVRDKPKLDRGLYRGVNGLWYYDIYMEGKHLRGCTWKESKTAARKWLNEFRALQGDRLIGKGPKDPAQTLKTIYEAWAKAQAEKVSAEHLNDMRVAVLVHAQTYLKTPLDQLNNVAIDGPEGIVTHYLGTTGAGYRNANLPHTLGGANSLLKRLRALCGWAITQGYIEVRPFSTKDLRVQEESKGIVWPERMQEFIAEADRGGPGRTPDAKATEYLHSATAIRMMLALGLREDEALHAEWHWIDWRNSCFIVKLAKNRRIRSVYMPAWLVQHLTECWERADKPTQGLILPDTKEDGSEVPHWGCFTTKPVARIAKKLGIADLTPHRLRATFATTHYEAGTALSQISQMMGHTGKTADTTTMGYIVQRPTGQVEAQQKVAKLQGFKNPSRSTPTKRTLLRKYIKSKI
jgi:integrase